MNSEPFVGVRGFLLSDDLRLLSLVMPTSWDQAEVGPAVCYPKPEDGTAGGRWYAARDPSIPGHLAPHEGCRCGFGAYHVGALEHSVGHVEAAMVVGLVVGYDIVLPGSKGWRASYARLMAVMLPRLALVGDRVGHRKMPPPDVLHDVAERYGVPVVPRAKLARYASEFGQVLAYQPDIPQRYYK